MSRFWWAILRLMLSSSSSSLTISASSVCSTLRRTSLGSLRKSTLSSSSRALTKRWDRWTQRSWLSFIGADGLLDHHLAIARQLRLHLAEDLLVVDHAAADLVGVSLQNLADLVVQLVLGGQVLREDLHDQIDRLLGVVGGDQFVLDEAADDPPGDLAHLVARQTHRSSLLATESLVRSRRIAQRIGAYQRTARRRGGPAILRAARIHGARAGDRRRGAVLRCGGDQCERAPPGLTRATTGLACALFRAALASWLLGGASMRCCLAISLRSRLFAWFSI